MANKKCGKKKAVNLPPEIPKSVPGKNNGKMPPLDSSWGRSRASFPKRNVTRRSNDIVWTINIINVFGASGAKILFRSNINLNIVFFLAPQARNFHIFTVHKCFRHVLGWRLELHPQTLIDFFFCFRILTKTIFVKKKSNFAEIPNFVKI